MGRRQLVRVTEPLAMDPVRPAVVGTVLWAAALVVLLVRLDDLAAADRWWVATATVGTVAGLLGCLAAARVRRAQRSARSSSGSGPAGSSTGPGSAGTGPPSA